MKKLDLGIILILSTLLAACSGQGAINNPDYYVPPTLSQKQVSPIPLRTETPIPPTPTKVCENDLAFLDDITIPDGTVILPEQNFEKIWLVSNSGECDWAADYTVKFVDGISLNATEEHGLYPARRGGEAEVRIIFTAPSQEGLYISAWQAHSPFGVPFGEVFFVQIVVDNDAQNNLPIIP
jgi:hypothetical protein